MIFICILILIIKLVRLYFVTTNLISRPSLPSVIRIKERPKVSVLIRTDSHTGSFYHLLDMVHKLEYGSLEIIIGVFKDDTNTIEKIRQQTSDDMRFTILPIDEPPAGWSRYTYMNYKLGEKATGSYLLFISSKVEIRKRIIETLIGKIQQTKASLISVLPEYYIDTPAEWCTLPIFNYLYLSLLPYNKNRLVSDPFFKAEGNLFLFFEGNSYRSFQPYEEVKSARNDCESMVRYYKNEKLKVSFFIGWKRVTLEGYVSWKRCITSTATLLFNIFGNNKTFAATYIIYSLLWLIPFIIGGFYQLLFWTIVVGMLTRFIAARILGENWFKYIIYAIPQNFTFIYIIGIILKNKIRNK